MERGICTNTFLVIVITRKKEKKTQKVFGISHRLEKKNANMDELFYNLKILKINLTHHVTYLNQQPNTAATQLYKQYESKGLLVSYRKKAWKQWMSECKKILQAPALLKENRIITSC